MWNKKNLWLWFLVKKYILEWENCSVIANFAVLRGPFFDHYEITWCWNTFILFFEIHSAFSLFILWDIIIIMKLSQMNVPLTGPYITDPNSVQVPLTVAQTYFSDENICVKMEKKLEYRRIRCQSYKRHGNSNWRNIKRTTIIDRN